MRIPGWQELRPEELADRIEETLHEERRRAVQVIERRIPYHGGSPFLVATTLPWVGIAHLRMMSWPERISWLVWISLFTLLGSCLLYTSPSPRDLSTSRMPSSA